VRKEGIAQVFAFLVTIGSLAAWAGLPTIQVRLSTAAVAGLAKGGADKARYLTGQGITIDGGYTAQ
jgi:hypothetical protein